MKLKLIHLWLVLAIMVLGAAPVSTQSAQRQARRVTLQPSQVAGVAATTVTRTTTLGLEVCNSLDIIVNVTATGTATGTLQIYLEDSADGGITWDDLVSSNTFAFGAAVITQRFFVNGFIATTATQGSANAIETLAAGTVRSGPFGGTIRIREKVSGPSGSPVGPTYSVSAVCKQ